MITHKWKQSKIDLDKYIPKEDLDLLRNKKDRKDKKSNNNIRTRNLELVREAKKGNDKSRNTLFLLNTPYIRNLLCKKFKIMPEEFNDYLSESFIYFVEAVKDFNEKKNNNFIAFLKIKLESRFKNDFWNKNLKKNIVKSSTVYLEDLDKNEIENRYITEMDLTFD